MQTVKGKMYGSRVKAGQGRSQAKVISGRLLPSCLIGRINLIPVQHAGTAMSRLLEWSTAADKLAEKTFQDFPRSLDRDKEDVAARHTSACSCSLKTVGRSALTSTLS